MAWFLMLQGLAIVALGVWGLVATPIPAASALAIAGVGLVWAVIGYYVAGFQRHTAALREAYARADPAANRQNRRQKVLLWVQWGSFAACMVWIVATARLAGPNEMWSLYGAGVFLAIMFVAMLYRIFLTSNLDAAAAQALGASFSGRTKKQRLGKTGQGALTVVLIIAIVAGVSIDEIANLPFKFMSVFWLALGLMVLWTVGLTVWAQIRKRLPKRKE